MGQAAARAFLLGAVLLLAGCKVELFANLPEAEANEVVGLLLQAGVSASKSSAKDGVSAISVEEAEFPRAVAILKQHGLPRKQFQTIGDVFQQSGLVVSPIQERARFLWALGQELSSTVSQIDGVLTARVQVVLPDNDVMRRDPSPSSASVFVRYSPHSPAERLVPQIKSLVANSIEGLTYERVSVVMVPVDPEPLPLELPKPGQKDQLQMAVGGGLLAVVTIVTVSTPASHFRLAATHGRVGQAMTPSPLDVFYEAPARFATAESIASLIGHGVPVQLASQMLTTGRLQAQLNRALCDRLGACPPELTSAQSRIASLAPVDLTRLALRAGAIWHAGLIASIYEGTAVRALIERIGADFREVALHDIASGAAPRVTQDKLEVSGLPAAIARDGAACLVAWCEAHHARLVGAFYCACA